MKNKFFLLSSVITTLLLTGCSKQVNEIQVIKHQPHHVIKNHENSQLKTVINYNDNVKSKVVPPTALKAVIYPIKDKSTGSFTDKQEVYYWVSKAKFRGEKKSKEIEIHNKIKQFLEKNKD